MRLVRLVSAATLFATCSLAPAGLVAAQDSVRTAPARPATAS